MTDLWIIIGLSSAIALSIVGIFLSLRAAARLGRLLSVVKNLEWDSVAELAMDVQKLKKQVQRYRNDENAQMKTLHKAALHQAADAVIQQPQQNVTNMRGG